MSPAHLRYVTRRHQPPVRAVDVDCQISGSLPPLSRDREAELVRAYQDNDDSGALDLLVRCNLRFVMSVAHEYEGRGLPLHDLYSSGCVGLMTGIRKYRAETGNKLISYAVHWIRQAILAALNKEVRTVRLPVNVEIDRRVIAQHRRALETCSGEPVSMQQAAEDAARVGMVTNGAADRHWVGGVEYSIDAKVAGNDNDKRTIADLLTYSAPDDDLWTCDELRDALRLMLGALDARARRILTRYFGMDGHPAQTLEQIGAEEGITRERVRQLRDKALGTLRERLAHRRGPGSERLVELLEAA